jgi:hypothetical protein
MEKKTKMRKLRKKVKINLGFIKISKYIPYE